MCVCTHIFFLVKVQLIYNISGMWQIDWHMHYFSCSKNLIFILSILFQILFPFRLLQNIEQSSLCYIVGLCWLSILSIILCTRPSKTSSLSLTLFPPGNHKLVLLSLCFCLVNNNSFVSFLKDSACQWYHMIFVFLCLTSLSVIISRSIHVVANGIILLFLMAE